MTAPDANASSIQMDQARKWQETINGGGLKRKFQRLIVSLGLNSGLKVPEWKRLFVLFTRLSVRGIGANQAG